MSPLELVDVKWLRIVILIVASAAAILWVDAVVVRRMASNPGPRWSLESRMTEVADQRLWDDVAPNAPSRATPPVGASMAYFEPRAGEAAITLRLRRVLDDRVTGYDIYFGNTRIVGHAAGDTAGDVAASVAVGPFDLPAVAERRYFGPSPVPVVDARWAWSPRWAVVVPAIVLGVLMDRLCAWCAALVRLLRGRARRRRGRCAGCNHRLIEQQDRCPECGAWRSRRRSRLGTGKLHTST